MVITEMWSRLRNWAQIREVRREVRVDTPADGVFLGSGRLLETVSMRPKKGLAWLAPRPAPPTTSDLGPALALRCGTVLASEPQRRQVTVSNGDRVAVFDDAQLELPTADHPQATIEGAKLKQIIEASGQSVVEDKQRGGVDRYQQQIITPRNEVFDHVWDKNHLDQYVISPNGTVRATQYATVRTGRAYQVYEARALQAPAQLDGIGAILAQDMRTRHTITVVPFVTTAQIGTAPPTPCRALVKYVPPAGA